MIETKPILPLSNDVPNSLSTRRAAGETIKGVYLETLTIPQLEVEMLNRIHELLNRPSLKKLIADGEITFGMVKPNASDGIGLPEDDDSAAQAILDEIGDNAVFALPFKLREEDAREFYSNLAERPEVYDSVVDFTTSGPLTAILIRKPDALEVVDLEEKKEFRDGSAVLPGGLFLRGDEATLLTDDVVVFVKSGMPIVKKLSEMTEEERLDFKDRRVYYREDGQDKVKIESAVVWWRDKMGDTRPEQARVNNPPSIRARHANGVPNNIVHGSDSPESVMRELSIIDGAIVDLINKNKETSGAK
jgi:nucleoside diphosphate kinase